MSAARLFLVFLLAAVGGPWASFGAWGQASTAPSVSRQRADVPDADLLLVARVAEEIVKEYVDAKNGHELVMAAVRSMVSSLDKHSVLIENVSPVTLRDAMSGAFGGVGVELEMSDEGAMILDVFQDSPAERAGLRATDRIVAIDGLPVRGRSLEEVIASIKGPPRTLVRLGIVRSGGDGAAEFSVERQLVRFRTVNVSFSDSVALVRISEFVDSTPVELIERLLDAVRTGHLRGVVLDLRGNAGGVVDAGVGVVSLFMPSNKLVYTSRGRHRESSQRHLTMNAFPQTVVTDAPRAPALREVLRVVPLVVVVDRSTASSAEIVAGALQDHGRALVIGCGPTLGKGSIQTIVPLTQGYALKLTTARFATPKGREIEGDGIVPDVMPSSAAAAGRPPAEAVDACDRDSDALLVVAQRELKRLGRTASGSTPAVKAGS